MKFTLEGDSCGELQFKGNGEITTSLKSTTQNERKRDNGDVTSCAYLPRFVTVQPKNAAQHHIRKHAFIRVLMLDEIRASRSANEIHRWQFVVIYLAGSWFCVHPVGQDAWFTRASS